MHEVDMSDMSDPTREAFERVTVPAFGTSRRCTDRLPSGEYRDVTLEEHWNTFQEGWEAAVEFLKNKSSGYSDITTIGGFDPRS
jgi:hypothetical protein